MRGKKFFHYIDRSILRVLLWILSIIQIKKDRYPKAVEHIAVLKLSGIGDLALATCVLLDIEKSFPQAKLLLFVGKENALLKDLFPTKRWKTHILNINEPLSNIRAIRKHKFDMFIDLGQWTHYEAVLAYLSGAPKRVGFKSKGQYRHVAFTHTVEHSSKIHEFQNFQNLCIKAGGKGSEMPKLSPPSFSKLQNKKSKVVVFHPWPSGLNSSLKEWPIAHWKELAQKLIKDGYEIYVSAANNDRQRQDELFQCFEQEHNITDLCGTYSLQQLAGFLCQDKEIVLVSVNTGIMHVGALLGVKVVALHGPTNPERWGPIGNRVVNLLPSNNQFSACLNYGFEYPKNMPNILTDIKVIDVYKAIFSFDKFK